MMSGDQATRHQAFSQNLKSGRTGGIFPHKFGKALVHFASFSPRIGRPQETWMPFWLKACNQVIISVGVVGWGEWDLTLTHNQD